MYSSNSKTQHFHHMWSINYQFVFVSFFPFVISIWSKNVLTIPSPRSPYPSLFQFFFVFVCVFIDSHFSGFDFTMNNFFPRLLKMGFCSLVVHLHLYDFFWSTFFNKNTHSIVFIQMDGFHHDKIAEFL